MSVASKNYDTHTVIRTVGLAVLMVALTVLTFIGWWPYAIFATAFVLRLSFRRSSQLRMVSIVALLLLLLANGFFLLVMFFLAQNMPVVGILFFVLVLLGLLTMLELQSET